MQGKAASSAGDAEDARASARARRDRVARQPRGVPSAVAGPMVRNAPRMLAKGLLGVV